MAASKLSFQLFICITITATLTISASAEPIKVVSTGDSITLGYSPYLPDVSSGMGSSYEFVNIATGGLNSSQYNGITLNGHDSELRNYDIEVTNEEPDCILFMLGANDCVQVYRPDNYFSAYKNNIQDIFDTFSAASGNPKVYVSTIIPLIAPEKIDANNRVDDWYNPWIRETVEQYGFTLVDMNAAIQQINDWQSLYNGDGVHLATDGRAWMAEQWVKAITPIPEPASLLLLGMGGIALIRKRNQ